MIYSVFDLQDLVLQGNESVKFARYVIKDLPAIFITHSASKEKISDIIHKYNLDSSVHETEKYESLDSFISAAIGRDNDWFLVFGVDVSKYKNCGRQFVFCPYEFWGSMGQFETNSFTEHAKQKLLYNELSGLYMDSIANDTELEVDFLKSVFARFNSKKILDCCCGIGRHARRLAEAEFTVTGVDASNNQINTALMQNNHANVRYCVSDARTFKLEEKYDAGICMWTTYNYFSKEKDINALLDNIYDHLTENGILVLDSKNIPILDSNRFYHRRTQRENVDLTLLVYKRVIGMVQNSQYFYFINKGTEKSFYMDEEFVRFYSLQELVKLNEGRFKLVDAYGDFRGNAYIDNHSERMITVWKKA